MIVIDTKENEKIYGRAYKELYVIILNLTKEMKEKIPKNVIENISRKMDKTYGKIKKSTYKLKAHDEENKCQVGDTVKVMETRPLSKDKRFRVVEITAKAIIK